MISKTSSLHTLPTLVSYENDFTLQNDCSLLSSLKRNAISLTSSVNALDASLLNLWWDLNTISLFYKNVLSETV